MNLTNKLENIINEELNFDNEQFKEHMVSMECTFIKRTIIELITNILTKFVKNLEIDYSDLNKRLEKLENQNM